MAYTLADLTTEIQRRANDSSYSPTEIADYLNDTQREVVNRHQWPFLEKTLDTTLSVGDESYSLPVDLDVSLDAYLVDPDDELNVWQVNYVDHDSFYLRWPNPAESPDNLPTDWTIFGEQAVFNCPPVKAYTFRQRYYKVAASLSGSSDAPVVPERYREVLVRGALSRLEERRDNFDFAAIHRNEFENLLEDMARRLVPKQFGTAPQLRTARVAHRGSF